MEVVPEAGQKVSAGYIIVAVQRGRTQYDACCDREFCFRNSTMRCLIFLSIVAMGHALPALIFTQAIQPIGVEYAQNVGPLVRPHPAVELNAASEDQLPRELLKSRDFYDNPAVAEGLAKESWFTNKEMQVVEREAEKIPRESIYKIVKSAGFLDRH